MGDVNKVELQQRKASYALSLRRWVYIHWMSSSAINVVTGGKSYPHRKYMIKSSQVSQSTPSFVSIFICHFTTKSSWIDPPWSHYTHLCSLQTHQITKTVILHHRTWECSIGSFICDFVFVFTFKHITFLFFLTAAFYCLPIVFICSPFCTLVLRNAISSHCLCNLQYIDMVGMTNKLELNVLKHFNTFFY